VCEEVVARSAGRFQSNSQSEVRRKKDKQKNGEEPLEYWKSQMAKPLNISHYFPWFLFC
jgi:hypothetical protein